MRMLRVTRILGKVTCGEAGATFIETIVALALLGIIAAAFLSGLATTSKASIIAAEQSTAESLARSQIEWAKNVAFVYDTAEYSPAEVPSGEDYIGYSAIIAAEPLNNPDDGIQKITVTVKHYDKEVLQLEGYKVDR